MSRSVKSREAPQVIWELITLPRSGGKTCNCFRSLAQLSAEQTAALFQEESHFFSPKNEKQYCDSEKIRRISRHDLKTKWVGSMQWIVQITSTEFSFCSHTKIEAHTWAQSTAAIGRSALWTPSLRGLPRSWRSLSECLWCTRTCEYETHKAKPHQEAYSHTVGCSPGQCWYKVGACNPEALRNLQLSLSP